MHSGIQIGGGDLPGLFFYPRPAVYQHMNQQWSALGTGMKGFPWACLRAQCLGVNFNGWRERTMLCTEHNIVYIQSLPYQLYTKSRGVHWSHPTSCRRSGISICKYGSALTRTISHYCAHTTHTNKCFIAAITTPQLMCTILQHIPVPGMVRHGWSWNQKKTLQDAVAQ